MAHLDSSSELWNLRRLELSTAQGSTFGGHGPLQRSTRRYHEAQRGRISPSKAVHAVVAVDGLTQPPHQLKYLRSYAGQIVPLGNMGNNRIRDRSRNRKVMLLARKNPVDSEQDSDSKSGTAVTNDPNRYTWLISACLIFGGVCVGSTLVTGNLVENSSNDEATGLLLWEITVGLLLVGIGQAVSVASHGITKPRLSGRMDGWGKCVSLGGWAVGLMPTIGLTGIGTGANPIWLAMFLAIVFMIVGTVGIVLLVRALDAKLTRCLAARDRRKSDGSAQR